MKKSFQIIALVSAACLLCSCNTFIGMGKDIQSLGNGMVNKGHGKSWSDDRAPATGPEKPQTPAAPAPAQ